MKVAFRWHDEPLPPADYDDIATLVTLARRMRRAWVDLEMDLDADELQALRRAVREWSTKQRGRYRAFDVRVLEAIDALSSRVPLREPVTDDGVGTVSCAEHDGVVRLHAITTFDIAFGYAAVGADPTMPGAAHLLETMRAALVGAFEKLGWDVHRMMTPRLTPARNALFGLSSRDDAVALPATGVPLVVDVHFEGPFALVAGGDAPSLFEQPVTARGGVYLWTVRAEHGYRPWYVGQTARSIAQRTAEHIAGYLSGGYSAHFLDSVRDGSFREIGSRPTKRYPASLPELLASLPDRMPHILELLAATRIFAAALDDTAHTLDRVEGALGRHYKATAPGYLLPGQRVPEAIPGDRPLVARTTCTVDILGLPSVLREPR